MHHRRVLQEKALLVKQLAATQKQVEEAKADAEAWKRKAEEKTREAAVAGAERERLRAAVEKGTAGVTAVVGESRVKQLGAGERERKEDKTRQQAGKPKGKTELFQLLMRSKLTQINTAGIQAKPGPPAKPSTNAPSAPPSEPALRPPAGFPTQDLPLPYTLPLPNLRLPLAPATRIQAHAHPSAATTGSPTSTPVRLAYHPRRDVLASASKAGWAVWGVKETADGGAKRMDKAVEGEESCDAVGMNGRFPHLATAHTFGSSGVVKVWDLAAPASPGGSGSGKDPVAALLRLSRPATCLAYHVGGELMAVAEAGGAVRVWDVARLVLRTILCGWALRLDTPIEKHQVDPPHNPPPHLALPHIPLIPSLLHPPPDHILLGHGFADRPAYSHHRAVVGPWRGV
ncbi:hypothetical protein M427DRAFT_290631 [Gonapodya prolifera JEL478]|uniref:WD40 repeat-like protein n=1 Tax=Gonapodya prolifera (strain JEL478) TaxID=1344416 RepID=A0A139AIA9_GONPJ|nr:hypothetical protein M427DRAFT_290631 [Gonapodya prolifera JEL478]|eukprot:KXS16439.1 hypothetical protein M427DRAFT_290631 [Gonapodya prolifera JEL478]